MGVLFLFDDRDGPAVSTMHDAFGAKIPGSIICKTNLGNKLF